MTNNIKPFPVSMEAPDDRLLITMSDGSIVDKGRLSGYPGTQMSELGVDSLGTAYWVDPLGERTELGSLFNRTNISYQGDKIGIYQGILKDENITNVNLINKSVPIVGNYDLAHILPFPSPGNYTDNGKRRVIYPGKCVISTGTLSSNAYDLSYLQKTTVPSGTYDGIRWTNSSESYVQWEFEFTVTLSAIDYSMLLKQYGLRQTEILHSMDGLTWHSIDPNKDIWNLSEGITRFDKPVTCKFFKIIEHYFHNSGIGRFKLLINRENLVLPVPVNTEWYDQEELILEETDDSFKLSPRYTYQPSLSGICPMTQEDKTILHEVLTSGKIISKDSYIDLNVVVTNPLNIKRLGKALLLPKGHYVIECLDTSSVLQKTGGEITVRCMLSKYNVDVDLPSSQIAGTDRWGNITTTSKFEFYLPSEEYVVLKRQSNTIDINSNGTVASAVVKINRLSVANETIAYVEPPAYMKYPSIFDSYSRIELDTFIKTNIINATGSHVDIFTDNKHFWELSEYTLSEGQKRYVDIDFPEAKLLQVWSYRHLAPGSAIDFTIEVYEESVWRVAGRSVDISSCRYGDVVTGLLDIASPVSKWRITFNGTTGGYISDLQLHDCTVPVLNDYILPTVVSSSYNRDIDSIASARRVLSSNTPLTLNDRSPVVLRLDSQFNLYIKTDGLSVITAQKLVIINLITGEEIVTDNIDSLTNRNIKILSELPPSIYSFKTLEGNMPIISMYFEKVSN